MKRPENKIIRSLSPADRKRFLAHCEPFELVLSNELSVRDKPLVYAHFPIEGFLSLVINVDAHPPMEVGMVGAEAMLGAELVLGTAATPWRALVQGEGSSWRIGAAQLREQLVAIAPLRALVYSCLLPRLHQQCVGIGGFAQARFGPGAGHQHAHAVAYQLVVVRDQDRQPCGGRQRWVGLCEHRRSLGAAGFGGNSSGGEKGHVHRTGGVRRWPEIGKHPCPARVRHAWPVPFQMACRRSKPPSRCWTASDSARAGRVTAHAVLQRVQSEIGRWRPCSGRWQLCK